MISIVYQIRRTDMKIAIVGGSRKCMELMQSIQLRTFDQVNPRIVAIADTNNHSRCMARAKSMGLYTTTDYSALLSRKDIDLIIDLTDDRSIGSDILQKKKKTVRYINSTTYQMFVEIFRDISTMRDVKHVSRQSRVMCDIMLNDLIKEEVMVIASDYRILDINEKLREKLMMERGEVIGRFCYEITHNRKKPCSGENHPCPLVIAMETWEPSQTTHIHMDRGNNSNYYSISAYPLIENGKVVGAIELSRNITPDIDRQKRMMQQEKLVSIGRLSAGVAHEINNPLTTILTTAMLLQEDIDPDDENYVELETIVKETLRCRKIVTNLLDFARQTKPQKGKYDINKLVEETMLLTNKQAVFKDVVLDEKLAGDIPDICIDKDQLQQVLINIILNAIEATDAGGHIRLATAHDPINKQIDIAVSDTGLGIPGELLSMIFEPFFTTKQAGTGLGLSIIHGIVEQHGGRIDVTSGNGWSTTFTIRLPTCKAISHTP